MGGSFDQPLIEALYQRITEYSLSTCLQSSQTKRTSHPPLTSPTCSSDISLLPVWRRWTEQQAKEEEVPNKKKRELSIMMGELNLSTSVNNSATPLPDNNATHSSASSFNASGHTLSGPQAMVIDAKTKITPPGQIQPLTDKKPQKKQRTKKKIQT